MSGYLFEEDEIHQLEVKNRQALASNNHILYYSTCVKLGLTKSDCGNTNSYTEGKILLEEKATEILSNKSNFSKNISNIENILLKEEIRIQALSNQDYIAYAILNEELQVPKESIEDNHLNQQGLEQLEMERYKLLGKIIDFQIYDQEVIDKVADLMIEEKQQANIKSPRKEKRKRIITKISLNQFSEDEVKQISYGTHNVKISSEIMHQLNGSEAVAIYYAVEKLKSAYQNELFVEEHNNFKTIVKELNKIAYHDLTYKLTHINHRYSVLPHEEEHRLEGISEESSQQFVKSLSAPLKRSTSRHDYIRDFEDLVQKNYNRKHWKKGYIDDIVNYIKVIDNKDSTL